MSIQNSEQIISEYHDFLTGRFSSYLFELMGYVENTFDKLKGDTEISIDAHVYDQSIAELRSRKYDIESRFKSYHHNYCKNLDLKNTTGSDDMPGQEDDGKDTNPVLKKTIAGTRLECKQALMNISDRVSKLLNEKDLKKFNAYIDPEPILVSIWNSLDVLENRQSVYQALSHIFESYSIYKLVNIYNDLSHSMDFIIAAKSDSPLDENSLLDIGNVELIDTYIENLINERIEKLEIEQQIRKIRVLAKDGNEKVQYLLGNVYYEGKYVDQDLEQAALWYRRAAEQGNNDAKYSLGNMFLVGRGTNQNDEMVKYWYEDADESLEEDTTETKASDKDLSESSTEEDIVQFFEVPDFIYQYLINIWSRVLVDIYKKQGFNSREWKEGVDIVDDMITWISIVDDDEMVYLQNCIYASMVFRLKKGMNRIALTRDAQLEFLSGLLEIKVKTENKKQPANSTNN